MKKLVIVALAVGAAAIPALAQPQMPAAQAPRAHGAQHMQRGDRVHTRAEAAAKVRDMFVRADANRDGFVTREEARAGRSMAGQHRGHAGKDARAPGARVADRNGTFDRLDVNRDGMLSRDEFSRAPAMRQRFAIRGEGQRAGARRAFYFGPGMMGLGGRMFELADANRDNRVSLQEATAEAMRRFDTADLNRDGQVTREERRQARERMRGQRQPG